MDPSTLIINTVTQFLVSQMGRQLVYFAVLHTTGYILRRAIWTPILNVIRENVPAEYHWILETLYWLIVNQIVRRDANIIANIVVVNIILALQP